MYFIENKKIFINELQNRQDRIVLYPVNYSSNMHFILRAYIHSIITLILGISGTVFVGAEELSTPASNWQDLAITIPSSKITILNSKPAGRYNWPIRVELSSTTPGVKIWYTCRRNGTPADLIAYSGAIILDRSCALVYFGYVSTQLESHIQRTDYTILYSDAIELETLGQSLALVNTSKDTIDIGNWEVLSGSGTQSVEPGTTILPGGRYELGRVDPAVYELRSPEGYPKSTASVVAPTPPRIVASVRPIPVPIKVLTPEVLVSPQISVSWAVITNENTAWPSSSEVVKTPSQAEFVKPINSLKVSTLESSSPTKTWIGLLIGLLIISGIFRLVQFIRSR